MQRIATLAVVAVTLSVGTATAAGHPPNGTRSLPAAARPAKLRVPATAAAKLGPALRARLARLAAGEKVSVSIWLDVPPLLAGRAESYAQYLARLRSYIADQRSGLVAALAQMRVTARVATYSPVVFADLTRGQVVAVASRADVKRIYGDDEYSLTG